MPIYPYSFQLPPLNVQDIPNDGVAGEFLGINGSGVLDWLTAGGGGTGDMLKSENLSGLASYPTARTNLGLGTGDSPTFANLTLTSPSLVSSAPVTISQTWAGTGSTVFTAFKVNATSTASASGSLLLDLQVGTVSQFSVAKNGAIRSLPSDQNGLAIGGIVPQNIGFVNGPLYFGYTQVGNVHAYLDHVTFSLRSNTVFGFSSGQPGLAAIDTALVRDGAANTLALRNGANAQTFNVYGTYSTSPSLAYSRLAIACDTSGNATLTTQSTGVAGTVSINGVPVGLGKGNVASNLAIGATALNANTTGSRNVAIGNESLLFVTTGLANTAIGAGSLRVAGATSIANTAIGDLALTYCVTSTYNTAIGQGAGTFVLSGSTLSNSSYSVFIGSDAKANSNSETNQIAIGHQAQGIGSNSVVLGNDSITKTALKGNVGIGTTAPNSRLEVRDITNNANTVGQMLILSTDALAVDKGGRFGLGGIYDGSGNTALWAEVAGLKENATSGNWAGYLTLRTRAAGGAITDRLRIDSVGNVGIGTTSPSSKLHVVGDAVLTGQLLGSDYTVGTVATATQANIAITNNHAGQTNSSVVISPKGTGAFILGPKPDGTAVGGNARGNYAVDHQLDRSAASDVASGPNSCIGGGQRNVASGAYSVVAGGQVTVASGSNSFAGGGLGVTASGSNSFAGGGQTNTASGAHSVVTGGTNNTASESFSFVYGGRNASANRYALGAHSAGQFSQVGDAQKTTAVFRNKTTTNSAVELFLDGALQRYTVTSGKIISMLINITGTKSDGSAVAHYVRQYSIKNIGGTTSQVYAAVTVGTDNAAGTSIAISADDTNDSLKIEVTGVASETWRWVASVDAVEVGHGV